VRKLSLFVLMLAALATAANAECDQSAPAHRPRWGQRYFCGYPQGPWTNEARTIEGFTSGWSTFTTANPALIYAVEEYFSTSPQGRDTRRIAFAKHRNLPAPTDPTCAKGPNRTVFEFTIAQTLQCTNTVVRSDVGTIQFSGCANGKTRNCIFF